MIITFGFSFKQLVNKGLGCCDSGAQFCLVIVTVIVKQVRFIPSCVH